VPDTSKKTLASRVFAHLTADERIDQACEILALGVMRLAEKRGLLKVRKSEETSETKNAGMVPLPPKGNLETVKKAAA